MQITITLINCRVIARKPPVRQITTIGTESTHRQCCFQRGKFRIALGLLGDLRHSGSQRCPFNRKIYNLVPIGYHHKLAFPGIFLERRLCRQQFHLHLQPCPRSHRRKGNGDRIPRLRCGLLALEPGAVLQLKPGSDIPVGSTVGSTAGAGTRSHKGQGKVCRLFLQEHVTAAGKASKKTCNKNEDE